MVDIWVAFGNSFMFFRRVSGFSQIEVEPPLLATPSFRFKLGGRPRSSPRAKKETGQGEHAHSQRLPPSFAATGCSGGGGPREARQPKVALPIALKATGPAPVVPRPGRQPAARRTRWGAARRRGRTKMGKGRVPSEVGSGVAHLRARAAPSPAVRQRSEFWELRGPLRASQGLRLASGKGRQTAPRRAGSFRRLMRRRIKQEGGTGLWTA